MVSESAWMMAATPSSPSDLPESRMGDTEMLLDASSRRKVPSARIPKLLRGQPQRPSFVCLRDLVQTEQNALISTGFGTALEPARSPYAGDLTSAEAKAIEALQLLRAVKCSQDACLALAPKSAPTIMSFTANNITSDGETVHDVHMHMDLGQQCKPRQSPADGDCKSNGTDDLLRYEASTLPMR
jgi:hypothetical protein